jgi:hypothetical protein
MMMKVREGGGLANASEATRGGEVCGHFVGVELHGGRKGARRVAWG